jgi:Big-like domain-containing protein
MAHRKRSSSLRMAPAAALGLVAAAILVSPSPAAAQGLFVTITSPASGSTVGGSITVSADANPLSLTQSVQFRLDGANLGAADTAAPYSIPWDTKTASNGSHTLTAVARNFLGIPFTSDPVTVTVFNDTTPPTVSITSPGSGSSVTGTIAVAASASDNVGVVGVQFRLDGALLGAEDTAAPYSVPWNTATASVGTHTLTAVGRDAAGNVGTSAPITVTVPDTTAPTAAISSPGAGATVTGTVTVSASASDNVGVAGVQFRLDGAPLGAEDTTAPYSAAWDTTTATDGSTHTLSATARDAAGNSTTSASVSVTVSNGPPPDTTPPAVAITSPAAGSSVSGAVAVAAAASDNVGVVGVQFRLDGVSLGVEDTTAPYSVTWDTTTATNGSTHTLSATARDAAGNTTTSASVSVTVSNGPGPDTTPPTVALTAPASGTTVSGVVTVSANAADDVGVAGVQFQVDGANLGVEDTAAPYSTTWDTAGAGEGSHTLRAVARDAAGNTATSATVTVTVSNNTPASGDVFVAIVNPGRVQWHRPDGTLRGVLSSAHDGQISSLAFDAARNLYVPHWWGSALGVPGNTVTRLDPNLNQLGSFGSGYNSDPSSVTFDANGYVYVGQADDSGDILKFDSNGTLVASFNVAVGNRGTDHIDLGLDGCTMFYTSRTKDVYRYDVCTNTQLPFFNTQPLPGDEAYHIRVLPDGGVLIADYRVIVRLDASGNQVQTYAVPGEPNFWGGVDHKGDGTFWASNAYSGNIYRFDLTTGAILASFNTGTGNYSAAGLAVKP